MVLVWMAEMPDLPCVLQKHWHRSEWHHLPGAGTVCVYRALRGSKFIIPVIICLCLNPETEKRCFNEEQLLLPSKAGIAFCHLTHQNMTSPIHVPHELFVLWSLLGWPQTSRGRSPKGNIQLTASARTKPHKCESLHPTVAIYTMPVSPDSPTA